MEYKLIRAKRKTIELSIDEDFTPLVKAPLRMSTADIEKFIAKHEKWIEKQIKESLSTLKNSAFPMKRKRCSNQKPCLILRKEQSTLQK